MAKQGSLLVVGLGIGGPSQTTFEAAAAIRNADVVLYLVTDPTAELWLRSTNGSAESLKDCYRPDRRREITYRLMTDRIVSAAMSGRSVCAVFYGHPGVFVEPSHLAIRQLQLEGIPARMLPAVSAEACLYADVGVNPGDCGVQSFEATDFLLWRRRFDPRSHLLLWQIGVLGDAGTTRPLASERTSRLRVLVARLRRGYPSGHPVTIYRAAMWPGAKPGIETVRLSELAKTPMLPISTLYVPPISLSSTARQDAKVANWLST